MYHSDNTKVPNRVLVWTNDLHSFKRLIGSLLLISQEVQKTNTDHVQTTNTFTFVYVLNEGQTRRPQLTVPSIIP